jgi:hypothetical protein
MREVVPGAFGAMLAACIPNSTSSQVRFKKSTPMSRSYNLFYEGPRKRHPHALGFACDLNLLVGTVCDRFGGAC